VRLGLQRVPEEDQQVDVAVRDPGADLLVAAQRAAEEAGDRQAELVAEQSARGRGRSVRSGSGPVRHFWLTSWNSLCGIQVRPPLNRCYRRMTMRRDHG